MRLSAKKKSANGKLIERDMTYESERSSIFNENLSVEDYGNRNNFHHHYALKNEDAKKKTDISFTAIDAIESARSVRKNITKKAPLLSVQVNHDSESSYSKNI